ncbi:MAG: peptide/nickel transport system permease protein [Propionibacteriaceae bacterium]|nr:peptide/nickel transport system permease protein [Propionibacteriaceae bacterium]
MKSMNFTTRFWISFSLVLATVLIGFVGPLIIKTSPDAVVGGLYDPPSGFGPLMLGTDNEGQSVLANLVYGTRTSLIVGLLAGTIASVIGLAIGIVAGYKGGVVDEILMGATNIALAIPGIVIIILLSIALDSRAIVPLGAVIGVTAWPWMARAVRAQATSVRTREHLDVARLSGARFWSILAWDLLPYLLSYVVMAFVLQVSGAILAEAALSLLGLGPSNAVSLGTMLYWAIAWGSVRTGAWWAFLPPTIMLTVLAFSLLLLQSSMDEVFNPRLRRGKAVKRRKPPSPRTPEEIEEVSPTAIGGSTLVQPPIGVSRGADS